MVMWLTLTQINESSCGHDIGMMGMWVWVDTPTSMQTQINEDRAMWVWVDFNSNQRIVTSTNRHVAQLTIPKSTDHDCNVVNSYANQLIFMWS